MLTVPELPDLPNENDLVNRVAEGDSEAFGILFHHYARWLHPKITRVVLSEAVANDIIQETFLRVWLSRDQLPGIDNLRAWISRIAYHRAFSYLRRKTVHEKAVTYISENASDNNDSTDEMVSFRHTVEVVKTAVSKLPGQQRKVYQLCREQGYKNKDVARMLGLSEQSVKNTLVRALKFVREYLVKAGYGDFLIFCVIFGFTRY